MVKNSFVYYLDQFNILSPNHSKIYDEYTFDTEYSKYSFTIDTTVKKQLLKMYKNNPKSVILTGNAGDGKTRLCRAVHDDLNENKLEDWPQNGIIDLSFGQGTLRIVKDLSELRDEVILKQLRELQESIRDKSKKIYFLIAANEGKLTKFLSKESELHELKEITLARLENHNNNNDELAVINLLDITTSVYVEEVLNEWNGEDNWRICSECDRKNSCVIFLNHKRISQEIIKKRLLEKYRILDYLERHVTMRELFIHLSYIITGGLVCDDIHNAHYENLSAQSQKIYYENFYGNYANSNAFSEMDVIDAFRMIDPGLLSQSEIDDFIINGDICGVKDLENLHKEIFNQDLDIGHGYFLRKLKVYRDHHGMVNNDFIDQWIPKLRRKLYFEIEDDKGLDRKTLLPFQYIHHYEKLFNDEREKAHVKTKIVNGLNRSFTNKLVEPSKNLIASSQDLMIYDEFKPRQVKIFDEKTREDIDFLPSKYLIKVEDDVTLPMNLYIFEYLMRIGSGGTHNILSEETNILIDTFKNELLKISEPEEYVLNILRLDRETGLYTGDQINL